VKQVGGGAFCKLLSFWLTFKAAVSHFKTLICTRVPVVKVPLGLDQWLVL
jgi:hypothetical protein